MATLTNKNQWYDVAASGSISTSFSGFSMTWNNVIQARWTNLSGTTYTVQYRCLVRKTGGNLASNTSAYDGYSIGGTGASTSSATNVTINFPNVGDNVIASTSGSINGTSGTVTGGVQLGYYGQTWGGTGLSGSITLPTPVPVPDLTGIGVTAATTTVGWFVDDGEGSLNGTGYIYGGTTASPTTQLFTTTLKNDTFIDTGLDPNTMYYYRGRIKDANNNWGDYTPDLRLTTSQAVGTLYGSVNGQTKRVRKLYGSVDRLSDFTASITGGATYLVSSFSEATFISKMTQDFLDYLNKDIISRSHLYLYCTKSGNTTHYNLSLVDDNSNTTIATLATTKSGVQSFGFSLNSLIGTIGTVAVRFESPTYTNTGTKEIKKLYGSVNGQTKLIYEI